MAASFLAVSSFLPFLVAFVAASSREGATCRALGSRSRHPPVATMMLTQAVGLCGSRSGPHFTRRGSTSLCGDGSASLQPCREITSHRPPNHRKQQPNRGATEERGKRTNLLRSDPRAPRRCHGRAPCDPSPRGTAVPQGCQAVPQVGGCGSRHRTPGGAVASPPRGRSPCGQALRAGNTAEPRTPPDSRSAARNRSAFNHRSINYSAALIINFLHSNPVPGESPSFLATVQRETNFPPSARGPTPPLLIPLLQTMPK